LVREYAAQIGIGELLMRSSLYLARRRNTIDRDNWSAAHAFCIMARAHSLLSANVDKTLSRRLARAQSASETLSSVCALFAWKTENVVYEFLVKSISC
jgi:hypothetical protein